MAVKVGELRTAGDVLSWWLRRQLTAALKQAERQGQGGGPGNDYVGRQNRAGTGGGNWTGD